MVCWLNKIELAAYKKLWDIGIKNINLGPIYPKNLRNNDATIRMSNKNNSELQTVKRDNKQ